MTGGNGGPNQQPSDLRRGFLAHPIPGLSIGSQPIPLAPQPNVEKRVWSSRSERDKMRQTLGPTHRRLPPIMERPYCQTLSFDDLEVLVLVEKGGATPREVDDALGMGRRETAAVFRDLVRRGLLDWEGRTRPPGALPMPWRLASTTFHLTAMARTLRADETFRLKAFAASLGVIDDDGLP